MSRDRNEYQADKKELGEIVREVGAWRDQFQTVLGLVHHAETDVETAAAAGLARRLQDHMVISAKRIHAFARRLGELAEQLDMQAAASNVHEPLMRED